MLKKRQQGDTTNKQQKHHTTHIIIATKYCGNLTTNKRNKNDKRKQTKINKNIKIDIFIHQQRFINE